MSYTVKTLWVGRTYHANNRSEVQSVGNSKKEQEGNETHNFRLLIRIFFPTSSPNLNKKYVLNFSIVTMGIYGNSARKVAELSSPSQQT